MAHLFQLGSSDFHRLLGFVVLTACAWQTSSSEKAKYQRLRLMSQTNASWKRRKRRREGGSMPPKAPHSSEQMPNAVIQKTLHDSSSPTVIEKLWSLFQLQTIERSNQRKCLQWERSDRSGSPGAMWKLPATLKTNTVNHFNTALISLSENKI